MISVSHVALLGLVDQTVMCRSRVDRAGLYTAPRPVRRARDTDITYCSRETTRGLAARIGSRRATAHASRAFPLSISLKRRGSCTDRRESRTSLDPEGSQCTAMV
jgi:hypothetical protein